VIGLPLIFALGDIAAIQEGESSKGHPQVAPVAIQQARLLAKNLKNMASGKELISFRYHDKGSMATVGRNLAVIEMGKLKIKGCGAWVIWMFVHLMSIIGIKNKLVILINWIWHYMTYDQSLRLILKPSDKKRNPSNEKLIDPVIADRYSVGL
jgi:NADH:ubiquinone reductase (H+-translocating)